MPRSPSRSRVREVLGDRTKVSVLFVVAMTIVVVLQFLNLTQVFENAPAWVWVLVWAVQLLVVLPAVIAYAVFDIRDARRKRRDRESRS